MRGMSRVVSAGLVLLLSISLTHADEQLTIVRNGASDFAIVVPAKSSLEEKLAAKELAHYLQRMSGAAMLLQPPGTVPAKALIVAEYEHLKTLGSAPIDLPEHPDTYAIARDGER